jgi:hypothetical protein
VDDPTECKLAYLAVVSHPAGETVAQLIDKFLQRRFAQHLWFALLRSGLHSGYVVAELPGSVPPHPFRGGHRLSILRVTSLAHIRNVAHSSSSLRSSATRTRCSASRPQNVAERFGQQAVQGIPDEALADALAEGFALPCFEFPRSPGSVVNRWSFFKIGVRPGGQSSLR